WNNQNRDSGQTGMNRDNRTGAMSADAMSLSPDARVLTIIHAKNLKEVELGRCAMLKAESDKVRDFGKELVEDHNKADDKLVEVARKAHIDVLSPEEAKGMIMHELHPDKPAGSMKDPAMELKDLRGADFDRAFASKMAEAHRGVIRYLESVQGQ